MTAVIPGTGGTIKSATAEGQLHEIMSFISQKQGSTSTNPTEANNVLASHDQQALLFSGSYQLPVTQSIGAAGALTLTANTYLTGTAFQVGADGTFRSNTPEGYALEVLMYLQAKEQEAGANPNNRNFISGTYNSDTGVYSGSFSIPVDFALDAVSGAVEYTAVEYLT